MFWSKETLQLRLMLIIGILFVVSAFTSCQEIRYATFGKTTDATLLKTQRVGGSRRPSLLLTYSFSDIDGTKRTEEDDVSMSFTAITENDEGRDAVRVQYIPGSPGASRIPMSGRWVLIAVFVVMLGAVIFVSTRFWIDFQKHQRRMAQDS